MTFFQFACNNVSRNGRAYAAYFLSSTFAILLFFLYATLSNHPDLLHKGYVSSIIIGGMQTAQGIICVFSFFSILYSMGSFLRGRNKEFGILTILGISNRQLIWMVFLENMLLGLASILVGLTVGLLLSKLFLMLGSLILDIPPLPFYIPVQALQLTFVAFLTLFALVSLAAIFFLRNATVLTLLTGSRRPKKEPHASTLLALLAFVLLVVAYILAVSYRLSPGETVPTQAFLVILLVAVGTYLLYGQLSVFLLQGLQKRRSYAWRGTHLLWISELAYNMKDNARLLFAIAMLLSVAFTATGTLAVEKSQMDATNSPFAFSLVQDHSYSPALSEAQKLLNQSLDTAHFTYVALRFPFITLKDSDNYRNGKVISASNYNRLAAAVQFPTLAVQPGEAIAFPYQQKNNTLAHTLPTSLSLGSEQKQLRVVHSTALGALDYELMFSNGLFVVTDQDYQSQTIQEQQGLGVVYTMSDTQWKMTTQLGTDLRSKMETIGDQVDTADKTLFWYNSRAVTYLSTYQIPNVLLFIGLFTAIIFLIASGSFLYFQLYTSLSENKERYRALSKIGLLEKEMRRSVTMQVVTLFFAPFLIAVLNTAFAMAALKNNMHAGTEVLWPTVSTIALFLALQVVYYILVRAQYLSQVKQVLI